MRKLREWGYWNLYGPVLWRLSDFLRRFPRLKAWLGRRRYGPPVEVIEVEYETIQYDRALTDEEFQQVNDYLARKWGLDGPQ